MNRQILLFLIVSLIILGQVSSQEKEEEKRDFISVLPDFIVFFIALAGCIVLQLRSKEIKGAIGKAFALVKIGLLFLAVAYLLVALFDLGVIERTMLLERIYEGISIIAIITIIMGPYFFLDFFKINFKVKKK
jgi:hypothetical protein